MKRKRALKIINPTVCAVLILCVAVTGVALFTDAFIRHEETAEALSYKQGSSGDNVKAIQTALQKAGYYTGKVDGIYGKGTASAVKKFQQANGLTADGIVGNATAKALGITFSESSARNSDLTLLSRIIYGEARGEPYVGQVAVGAVVLNRVKSSSFPNSVSGVIYQAGAFDAVSDGQVNLTPDDKARQAAQDALNGWDPTGGCLYYYNPKTATSKWMLSKPVYLSIGNHSFCL